ncbi:chemotaxis protein CheW [Aquabacterium sp.]|uniref:chemotaxis protein CheW n=1 Tax=Aquabacterium sp. TaxID=1872578 RepID=UPI002C487C1F|nr:chemotaxis protein CheW [Aquabacterium sp.]HSW06796.1 chemotaxis protein CheW [Aquabacterium sp.]
MSPAPKRTRAPVDWPAIKQRLAAADAALARGFAPLPDAQRSILRARARAVAAEAAPAVDAAAGIDVVEFALARQRYAFETRWVHEVQALKDLTPLPGTPAHVAGVINAHGRILAVIDLKRFFDLTEGGLTDLNKVLILRHEDTEFAVLADRIVGVSWLALAALQPALPTLSDRRADYLKGVTADGLVVLDAVRLLASPALVVDDGATR